MSELRQRKRRGAARGWGWLAIVHRPSRTEEPPVTGPESRTGLSCASAKPKHLFQVQLWQSIADLHPRRFAFDHDVSLRTRAGVIVEQAGRDLEGVGLRLGLWNDAPAALTEHT